MLKKYIKKVIVIFILIVLSTSWAIKIFADDIDEKLDYVWENDNINEDNSNVNISSKCAIAYDRNSKTILYGKNENTKVKMASTTKIMTAIILLENEKDLNKEVEVCKEAASIGRIKVGIKNR